MEEIEAKVLEIDSDRVRSRLEEQGAELVYDGEVCSRFYDFPDRRLWEEKGAYIRIREMEDHAFVTAKVDQSREGSKTMKEYEFDVGDPKAVTTVLELAGLEEYRTSQKHRTKYVDGDVEYVIDSYPDIPPLLEIEAPSEDQVFRAFDELGYGREETVPWDAQQVREHYS